MNDLTSIKASYAVIFTSIKKKSAFGYEEMAKNMIDISSSQPGFMGMHSLRGDDGFGITISYWKTLADIKGWKKNKDHIEAQQKGKSEWYKNYHVLICKIEHEYKFNNTDNFEHL